MSENQRDPQYKLRWSEELRNKVQNSAKEHNRSINAEICTRLENSFEESQDEEVEHHFMMEIFKEQEQKIDKLLKLVQSLKQTSERNE